MIHYNCNRCNESNFLEFCNCHHFIIFNILVCLLVHKDPVQYWIASIELELCPGISSLISIELCNIDQRLIHNVDPCMPCRNCVVHYIWKIKFMHFLAHTYLDLVGCRNSFLNNKFPQVHLSFTLFFFFQNGLSLPFLIFGFARDTLLCKPPFFETVVLKLKLWVLNKVLGFFRFDKCPMLPLYNRIQCSLCKC